MFQSQIDQSIQGSYLCELCNIPKVKLIICLLESSSWTNHALFCMADLSMDLRRLVAIRADKVPPVLKEYIELIYKR